MKKKLRESKERNKKRTGKRERRGRQKIQGSEKRERENEEIVNDP